MSKTKTKNQKQEKITSKEKEQFKVSVLVSKEFWNKTLNKLWPERIIHKPNLRLEIGKIPEIPMPSRNVLFLVLLGFMGFIIAGGIYDMTRFTIPLSYQNIGGYITPEFFWKDLHEQFIIEGIGFAIVVMIGFGGTYSIYHASRHFYRPGYAYIFILIGIIMILASFFFAEAMIQEKGVNFYSPKF
ncbi:MAG: hypothetical protein ACTSVY_02160 [Candidatus Helarchaeota archaeon]